MGEEEVTLSFAKNEQDPQQACTFPRSDLGADEALFPAIATKNQVLEVDFGQKVSQPGSERVTVCLSANYHLYCNLCP